MPSPIRSRLLSFRYPLLAAAVIPPAYFLHESGHYLVAILQGYHPVFTYNAVILREPSIPGTSPVASFLGRPAVDLLLTLLGILGVICFGKGPAPVRSLGFWISTALTLRALHWFAMPWVAASDESRISVMLGMPPWLFPSFWVPVALVALWVVLREHRRMRTLPQLGIHVIACSVVSFVYMAYLGPALFPRGIAAETRAPVKAVAVIGNYPRLTDGAILTASAVSSSFKK